MERVDKLDDNDFLKPSEVPLYDPNRHKKITAKAVTIFKQLMALMAEDRAAVWHELENYDDALSSMLLDQLAKELDLSLAEWPRRALFPDHQPVFELDCVGGMWEKIAAPLLYRDLCKAAGIEP
jgi:hypothetical protein